MVTLESKIDYKGFRSGDSGRIKLLQGEHDKIDGVLHTVRFL